jgi:hypothetical protein
MVTIYYISYVRAEIATGIKLFWDRKNVLIPGRYLDPVIIGEFLVI